MRETEWIPNSENPVPRRAFPGQTTPDVARTWRRDSDPRYHPPPMTRPVLIVFNPVSGRGEAARFATELATALEARGASAELLETRADRDVFASIDPHLYRSVVIVGGDGSFHAAVNGLRALETPLGFGGTGTVNVLSLEQGLSDAPGDVARLLHEGRTAEVPLFAANGRRWVLFAEAGFLGTIVRRVNRWRTRTGKHGKTEFVTTALRVLPLAWGRPIQAVLETCDGRRLARTYSNVLATRARLYAGNMRLPMDGVDLTSAHFQVIGFRTRTPFGHLALLGLARLGALPLLRGLLTRLGLLDCIPCRGLAIEGPRAAGVHLDAESTVGSTELQLPLRVDGTQHSIQLLVP